MLPSLAPPHRGSCEALSLPASLPGNHQARGSDWRRRERGQGRGRGASCEVDGEWEGKEARGARPARPHFLSERGNVGSHLTRPAWVARLGPLVSPSRKGLRAPRGQGEWAELRGAASPGLEAETRECLRPFCRRSDLPGWSGRAGPGATGLTAWWARGCSWCPSPLPARLRLRGQACAGRPGGRGQHGS